MGLRGGVDQIQLLGEKLEEGLVCLKGEKIKDSQVVELLHIFNSGANACQAVGEEAEDLPNGNLPLE